MMEEAHRMKKTIGKSQQMKDYAGLGLREDMDQIYSAQSDSNWVSYSPFTKLIPTGPAVKIKWDGLEKHNKFQSLYESNKDERCNLIDEENEGVHEVEVNVLGKEVEGKVLKKENSEVNLKSSKRWKLGYLISACLSIKSASDGRKERGRYAIVYRRSQDRRIWLCSSNEADIICSECYSSRNAALLAVSLPSQRCYPRHATGPVFSNHIATSSWCLPYSVVLITATTLPVYYGHSTRTICFRRCLVTVRQLRFLVAQPVVPCAIIVGNLVMFVINTGSSMVVQLTGLHRNPPRAHFTIPPTIEFKSACTVSEGSSPFAFLSPSPDLTSGMVIGNARRHGGLYILEAPPSALIPNCSLTPFISSFVLVSLTDAAVDIVLWHFRYKARLVAKGFTQTHRVNYLETFAPVVKLNTIRVLSSLPVNNDWIIHQLDIKNAFLNDNLEEKVYMQVPQGIHSGITGYCQSDHTLFVKIAPDKKKSILIVYVDDIIITGDDLVEIEKLKTLLAKEFETKDLGTLRYFLGMEIDKATQNKSQHSTSDHLMDGSEDEDDVDDVLYGEEDESQISSDNDS
ncbi:hypothetical protein F3Y22_tig00110895pilonHSYRG00464 [Hibiscus syriacus]|uniref:Reverse transcriptase Ty1/copia-type domain-containing protein n=1 Tax=Hibiscus syriacus TaxID=106335 RepID=A0A6A2ZGH6_HIBSY|nr:hypothetical protein F3Y22_tig00110895pilonHSYRG00464 [Hibiscus syriacus]